MTEALLKKMVKAFRWLLGSAIILYLAILLSDIILIVMMSILLAFIFIPFVDWLESEGLNRLTSTLIVFIIVGFVFYFSVSSFVPRFIFQLNQLIETLHVYDLHDQIIHFEQEIYKYLPFFTPGELAHKIETFISTTIVNSIDQISTILTSIVSVIAIIVIVPFITFFLLKDRRIIIQGLLHTMPNKYFEMSYWIIKKVSIQLGRFVRGWIFDAAFVGVMCGLGFYIVGINYALPLGVIAGVGHLVPYLGPIIGGVPAIVISIIQFGDVSYVPYIVLIMAVVYTFDNGFVQPYVFAKSVDMHPIVIILLIITGSQLYGIFGMLLAVPSAAVIRTAAKEIYFAFKNYRIARL